MASDSFIITGGVDVQITVTELGDGTLQFDIDVLDTSGSIGDLNALYFDLFDDSLTNSLSVTGDDVTGTAFKEDGVTKVSGYTNMNGEVVKDLGKFDGGVQFGTSGIGADDIRSTSFVLSSDSADLTLADFSLQDFGVRLTSVGTDGGSREDSLKLGGTAPELEGEDPGPACDDTLTVNEDEISAPPIPGLFPTDTLDSGALSLLDNNADAFEIIAVEGGNLGEYVDGSNGGFAFFYADGTFDFDAGTDFGGLYDGETAMTEFTYTMDNGLEATLCVNVTGITNGGGPGGEG